MANLERMLPLRRVAKGLAEFCGISSHAKQRHGGRGGAGLSISPDEAAAYRDRGFFIRERVFGEADLKILRDSVEEVHARIVEAGATGEAVQRVDGRKFQTVLGSVVKWEWNEEEAAIRSMEPVYHLSSAIDRIIDDERLCLPAQGLLNVDRLSLFTAKLNFKRPGGAPFPWHQDAPYWAFDCKHLDKLTSVQIYLDDATVENGCLWMIPGSHTQGHIKAPENSGALGRLYTDLGEIAHLEPQPLIAPAGSIIFFDGYIVHGSKSNRTATNRRALIFTYQPAGLPMWGKEEERIPVDERAAG